MADTNKFVQTNKTTLYGSGCTSSATSIILSTLKLPDGSTNIAMTDFGSIGFGTIEPGTSREEQISFTGITQNGDGTATLTGVTRGLRFVSPYDEVSGNKFAHAGGATFVVTNTAGFYDKLLAKGNDETITGLYTFSSLPQSSDTPVADEDLTTKSYVDSIVNGGEVSINRVVVSGTAGQDLAADALVYLKTSDSKWWKVDADLTATIDSVILGIAQGTAVADGAIDGGVLISGVHTTTGLTANSLYYASNTAGAISTSAGTLTKVIGLATSTTSLHFDPVFYAQNTLMPASYTSTSAGAGDTGKGVLLSSDGKLDGTLSRTPIVKTYGNQLYGDTTSRFDITNPSGTTFRYTWDTAGTDPTINTTNFPVNSKVIIQKGAQSISSVNAGVYTITASGANYFEVTNASGSAEINVYMERLAVYNPTWTKPTGLTYAVIEVIGGGGGGSGCTTDNSASHGSGAGGYAKKTVLASVLGSTETVTVGKGGERGAANSAGETGGTSSFTVTSGSTITAYGGVSATNDSVLGDGGLAINGDINIQGGCGGEVGHGYSGSEQTQYAGFGGASVYSGTISNLDNTSSAVGKLYGGGCCGVRTENGGSSKVGAGCGGHGIVIVTEYFN